MFVKEQTIYMVSKNNPVIYFLITNQKYTQIVMKSISLLLHLAVHFRITSVGQPGTHVVWAGVKEHHPFNVLSRNFWQNLVKMK